MLSESNAFYVLNKIGTTSVDGNLQDDLQDMFPGGDINLDLTINMPVIGDLTLNTLNNGVILLNDGIDGESGYGIAFNGDKGIEEENLRTTQYIHCQCRQHQHCQYDFVFRRRALRPR